MAARESFSMVIKFNVDMFIDSQANHMHIYKACITIQMHRTNDTKNLC